MPRDSADDGLLAKFTLLTRLPFDPRMKRQHFMIYGFILDWYHRGHGDALASVRHVEATLKERDPAKAGLSVRHIHQALTDLVAWGYLEQQKGTGRLASRYVPVWAGPQLCVSPGGNTSDAGLCVSPVGNASVSPVGNTNARSVSPVGNEDPSTMTRVTDAGTCSDIQSSAPLADGLPATAAGDGFERLALAYGKRGDDLAKARAAFKARAPDAGELENMIAAAAAWKRTARGNRMSLARWIEEVRWLGDDQAAGTPPAPRWPACVVTRISPRYDEGFIDGAKLWFRDRTGAARMRVLDRKEFGQFQDACIPDRPAVTDPSDDMHEFIGARFQIDGELFEPVAALG